MHSLAFDVLAPVAGVDVTELFNHLGAEGLVVDAPGMTNRQLAERYDAEATTFASRCFREREDQTTKCAPLCSSSF